MCDTLNLGNTFGDEIMKAIKCELCGSNDIIKQDGLFVCQYCGTKYSLEEARKLMIEGKIDVTGSTVKIDNSSKLENLLKLARRAKSENNYTMSNRYYESILIEDPDNWEAVFYCAYLHAIQTDANGLIDAYLMMQKSTNTLIQLLVEQYSDSDELPAILTTIVEEINNLETALFIIGQKYYLNNKSVKYAWSATGIKILQMDCDLGNLIESSFEDKEKVMPFVLMAWKNGIQTNSDAKKGTSFPNKSFCQRVINFYNPKVLSFDKSFVFTKQRKNRLS